VFSKQPFPNILTRKGIVAVASVARSTPRWLDCQVPLTNCRFHQWQLSDGITWLRCARFGRAAKKGRGEDSGSQIIQSD